MRKTKYKGSFFICLLINLVLNLDWAIPGIVLLGLHFWLGLSIWFSVIAFALWILMMVIWMLVFGWARNCGNTPDPHKDNKNPYSVKKPAVASFYKCDEFNSVPEKTHNSTDVCFECIDTFYESDISE